MGLALLAQFAWGDRGTNGKMNGTRNTDWLILTTGVALAGMLANAPVVSLVAALTALLATHRGEWSRPVFAPGGSADRGPLFGPGDLAASLVFRSFRRGDSSPSPDADAAEDAASGKRDDTGSRSYREFAANLDDDGDEEISFMPHYASDVVDPKGATEAPAGGADSILSDDLKQVEQRVSKLPVPRRFALGTVAIIRRLLEPSQVEQILLEQRRYPRLRFGDVAVQLDLLTEAEVQELLVAQEEGIFSDEEISDARRRLATYHNG